MTNTPATNTPRTLADIKQTVQKYFPIALGILAIFYWRWLLLAPSDAGYLYEIPLLLCYGVFVVVSKTSRLRRYMLFATIVFFLINCLHLFFEMPTLITSVDCDGKTYSIIYYPRAWEGSYYKVTTWKGMSNYSSDFFGYDILYSSSKFTCDKNTKEAKVFILSFHVLFQSYGTQTYTYEMKSRDWINDREYSLYMYDVNGVKNYTLAICKPDYPASCQFTPIAYSSLSDNELGNFLVDRKTWFFSILFQGDNGMVYTDLKDAPQKVKTMATYTPSVANQGKSYRVVSYQKDHSFVYVFYRCHHLDVRDVYNQCDTIPLSYTSPTEEDVTFDFNKTTDQLNLSIDGKLVYVYNHPFKP